MPRPRNFTACLTKPIRCRRTDRRRSAPFVPYLVWAPDDFALSLCFSGGGDYANGRFMFDADGNLWSGMNWMPGSQSGVNNSIGGGVGKFAPNGTALSPAITGFTGMGIDGVGWGTAVTRRQSLDHQLQRENSRDGFRRHARRQGERFPLQGKIPRPDGHWRRRQRGCLDCRWLGQSVAVFPRRTC